jgi:hypothetical protein
MSKCNFERPYDSWGWVISVIPVTLSVIALFCYFSWGWVLKITKITLFLLALYKKEKKIRDEEIYKRGMGIRNSAILPLSP